MQLRKTAAEAIETTRNSLNASLVIASVAIAIAAIALVVALAK